jgi:two-component system, OmpR family, sensor kinase
MRLHVFPEGPLCSLRRALMLWLVPLFLLVGAASAVFSYWSYSRMVAAFMDDQMQQLAHAVAQHDDQTVLPPLTAERVHKWGAYVTQVYAADGRLAGTSWPDLRMGVLPGEGFHDVSYDGRHWRVYVAAAAAPGGRTVQVMQSGQFRAHIAAERAGAALAPVLILLPLSMLVLWGVARTISRALQDIGRQAATQDEHTIAELPLDRVPQEIRPLVASFNGLLRRLRDAFLTQRRFVQDAAHELRTPITAIGLQLENLRGDCCSGESAQRFAQLETGVRRAQRLVDQLLKMSRHDAPMPDASSTVDLHAQLHESMNALIALADQRNIDLGLVAPEATAPLALRCVQADLRSVLDNLVENALRYTPPGGVVDIRLFEENGSPVVEVVDTGPGIPSELLPRVFDRFFRVPGNGTAGSGLGLAIAQAAAQRCGLAVTLRNRTDRSGLVARVEAVRASGRQRDLDAVGVGAGRDVLAPVDAAVDREGGGSRGLVRHA